MRLRTRSIGIGIGSGCGFNMALAWQVEDRIWVNVGRWIWWYDGFVPCILGPTSARCPSLPPASDSQTDQPGKPEQTDQADPFPAGEHAEHHQDHQDHQDLRPPAPALASPMSAYIPLLEVVAASRLCPWLRAAVEPPYYRTSANGFGYRRRPPPPDMAPCCCCPATTPIPTY